MKIQHYAIIFIIIILPFSIICKSMLNKKVDTINDQTRINNALDTATLDAVDTMIEANDEFYALYEGETLDVTPTIALEAIDIFFDTLAVNNNLPFLAQNEEYSENYFSPYIPAIVVVAYDGFYVYSIEDNGGVYEYVLSPKIPYAYEESGYIINFTLGNAIKLYAPNGVLYEGEFTKDFIDESLAEYRQLSTIFGSAGSTLSYLPQLTNDMSLIMYTLDYCATRTYEYRYLRPIPDFLITKSTDPSAVSMLNDYEENRDYSDVSAFHQKRRDVIINTIIDVLNEKMNNHNRYADIMGVNYDFYLPTIDDAEWINAVDDISIMAFMQGIPTGTDTYYNSYSLGGSRIIEASYIYGTINGTSKKYHLETCAEANTNLEEIFLNKVDAAKAGYNPCLICKP